MSFWKFLGGYFLFDWLFGGHRNHQNQSDILNVLDKHDDCCHDDIWDHGHFMDPWHYDQHDDPDNYIDDMYDDDDWM